MDLLFGFFFAFFIFVLIYFIFITTNIREIFLQDRMMISLIDIMQASTLNLLARYERYRQYL